MTGYIAANEVLPMEVVADEMLAILSDRDRIIDKHVSEHAQRMLFYRPGQDAGICIPAGNDAALDRS